MANLTLRTLTNAGDTTKGSRLTAEELDQNLIDLKTLSNDGVSASRKFVFGEVLYEESTWPGGASEISTQYWYDPTLTKTVALVYDSALPWASRPNTMVVRPVVEEGTSIRIGATSYPLNTNPNYLVLPAGYETRELFEVVSAFFNSDGTKFYVFGSIESTSTGKVLYYTVATPYQLTTASFVSATTVSAYQYNGCMAITNDFMAYPNGSLNAIYAFKITNGDPATVNDAKWGEFFFNDGVSYVGIDNPFVYFKQVSPTQLEIKVNIYDSFLGYQITNTLTYIYVNDANNSGQIITYGGESWGGCPAWWIPEKKLLIDNSYVLYSERGGLDPDDQPGVMWDAAPYKFRKPVSLSPFDADTEVTPVSNSVPAAVVPYAYEINVTLAPKNNYYLIPPNTKYPAGYEYHAYLTNTGMKFYRVSANSANIATGSTFNVTGRVSSAYFGRTNRATYTYYSV